MIFNVEFLILPFLFILFFYKNYLINIWTVII